MSEDNLKWSEYDSTKNLMMTLYVLVSVPCFIVTCSLLVGYWEDSATTNAPTVGLTPEATVKTTVPRAPACTVDESSRIPERGFTFFLLHARRTPHPSWIPGYYGASVKDVENTNYTLLHMTLKL